MKCQICEETVMEDLEHFLLECRELEEERREALELQRPRTERREEIMGTFLFGEGRVQGRRGVLRSMWRGRRIILKMRGEQNGEE